MCTIRQHWCSGLSCHPKTRGSGFDSCLLLSFMACGFTQVWLSKTGAPCYCFDILGLRLRTSMPFWSLIVRRLICHHELLCYVWQCLRLTLFLVLHLCIIERKLGLSCSLQACTPPVEMGLLVQIQDASYASRADVWWIPYSEASRLVIVVPMGTFLCFVSTSSLFFILTCSLSDDCQETIRLSSFHYSWAANHTVESLTDP